MVWKRRIEALCLIVLSKVSVLGEFNLKYLLNVTERPWNHLHRDTNWSLENGQDEKKCERWAKGMLDFRCLSRASFRKGERKHGERPEDCCVHCQRSPRRPGSLRTVLNVVANAVQREEKLLDLLAFSSPDRWALPSSPPCCVWLSLLFTMSSRKTFRIKWFQAKEQKQSFPIPQWIRVKTDGQIRYNSKRRHWRTTKLGV